MSREYGYSPSEITLANLDRLSRESSTIDELRLLEINDLASDAAQLCSSLIRTGLGIYDALSLISEGLSFGSYPVADTPLPDSATHLRAALRAVCGSDRARFSEIFVREMGERGSVVTEADYLPSVDVDATFTYVKNRFSDEAYDVLSVDYDDPRVRYSSSFKECAKALEDGSVSYCLFPLEEKGGARLPGIAELIYRHDFKINAVTPVFGFEGDADLKYALVSKHFAVRHREEGDDRYLELRISAALDSELSELICVASYLGFGVYRLNTVTIPAEGESASFFSIVLREGASGLSALLTYVALFAPDLVPVGVYKNLE